MRGTGKGGPRPVRSSLPRLLGRLGAPPTLATLEAVFTRWDDVVGADLSAHVRPVRIDGHALVVVVDHPSWATRARMASGRILGAINEAADSSLDRLEVVVERT